VRVARIFLLAALFVAYGTGSFAQSSALVAPLDPQRLTQGDPESQLRWTCKSTPCDRGVSDPAPSSLQSLRLWVNSYVKMVEMKT